MGTLSASDMKLLMDGADDRAELALPTDPLDAVIQRTPDGRVTAFRNINYLPDGEPRDAVRHRLDLIVPTEPTHRQHSPLIVWIHGGGWKLGGKDDLMGLYTRLGTRLARQGYSFAAVNYRLTPRVKHPEHARDVAAACTFLSGRGPEQWGIRTDSLILAGHSAGAHLASLLALDPEFGISRLAAGVVAISGIFDLTLPQPGEAHGIIDEMLVNLTPAYIHSAFSPGDLTRASPIQYVSQGAPPFLLMHEAQGSYMIEQTRRMADALAAQHVPDDTLTVPGTDHTSILVELLRKPSAGFTAMKAFVSRLR